MFERIREVYATYLQRIEFRVLVVVVFTLWTFQNIFMKGMSLWHISYLTFAVLVIVMFSALVGEQLKRHLASDRSHLVPHYRAPHLWTALGLSLIFGFFVCIPLAQASPNGFPGIVGIIAFLWSMGLLAFSTGYFLRPLFIFIFLSLWFITERIKASSVFLSVIAGRNPAMTIVLIVNSVVSILLVWRMTCLHEQMFEYRWMHAMDNALLRRAQDSVRRSLPRRIYDFCFHPSERPLDRIPRPLRTGRRAKMRHFQLSLAMGQPVLASVLLWTGIMWGVNFISGTDSHAAWLGTIMVLPTITLFSSTGGFQKNTLQWVGMLPLARQELVTTLGGAMLWSVLRWWASYAAAIYFVSWMPLPGSIRGWPPLLPFATSLIIQFPLFGVATLTAMNYKAVARGLAFGAVIAVSVFFSEIVATPSQVAFLIAATIGAGAALIWASYRHWCEVDID